MNRQIGVSFSVAKVFTGSSRTNKVKPQAVLPTISTPPSSGSILVINLVCPKPYTIYAPETKTTNPTERRIKKMSDSKEADNN